MSELTLFIAEVLAFKTYFNLYLPLIDLLLWDSTCSVLAKAQGQNPKEDVEGVGRAVKLGVSLGLEWRGATAAASLLQQSQGGLAQGAEARDTEPGYSK